MCVFKPLSIGEKELQQRDELKKQKKKKTSKKERKNTTATVTHSQTETEQRLVTPVSLSSDNNELS